ncbi:hypothetical protein [Cyanobium sp. ATX 6E8]|uniref:hypothetical protein n=1 Tax=Synechococcales TaxID=1890424 RepID=UPI0028F41B9D|nr:hypothetical protein [Cyanobium sp. ATX 6E8]
MVTTRDFLLFRLRQRLSPSLASVLLGLLSGLVAVPSAVQAQSALLESVKQNPARAKALCGQLRSFNAQGLAATSPAAVAQIARQENLSPMDAEVLTTYVIGLYCPDVH